MYFPKAFALPNIHPFLLTAFSSIPLTSVFSHIVRCLESALFLFNYQCPYTSIGPSQKSIRV